MKYTINYAVLCHKGHVRSMNQDNFWCAATFLESNNEGLPETLSGSAEATDTPAFAVFDGMGGEQRGEMAAYIAASQFDTLYRAKSKKDPKLFLLETCSVINDRICLYQQENHIRQMGTTAAILMFGMNDVYICNLGDSRVYLHSGIRLTQISHDHSVTGTDDAKPPLTQNLGIPETEFIIEPYIAKGPYRSGDRYLVCSDGLTDMVSESEMCSTLSTHNKASDAANDLMRKALENGGVDNISIILCEVRKQRMFHLWKKHSVT